MPQHIKMLCKSLEKRKFFLVDLNDRRNDHKGPETVSQQMHGGVFMMIDNEEKASALMEKMKAVLPIRARLNDDTRKSMKRQGHQIADCSSVMIRDLHYLYDEGGIMCQILSVPDSEKGGEPDNVHLVSITHLKIARGHSLWREINKYQKRRIKRLCQQGGAVY